MSEKTQKCITKHVILYNTSMVFFGSLFSALGPLIPYLATYFFKRQTQFSTLFLSRAIGVICSGFLIKIINKVFSYHSILFMNCLLLSIFSYSFFYFKSITVLSIMMGLIGMNCGMLEVTINMSLMEVVDSNNQANWLQALFGFYAVGGILGPLLVFFFEIKCYIAISIVFFILSPFYLLIKSPQQDQQLSKKVNLVQQYNPQLEIKQDKQLPKYLEYRISFLIFSFIGSVISFFGWIFSFVVIHKLFSKQNATHLNTAFYLCAIAFKFLMILYQQKTSVKVKVCSIGLLVTIILGSICCIFKFYFYGSIVTALVLGIFSAPIFSYLINIPTEYGMKITVEQRANFAIIESLGQVLITPLVGYLMQSISPDMLFYSVLFTIVIFFLVLMHTLSLFEGDFPSKLENDGLQQID